MDDKKIIDLFLKRSEDAIVEASGKYRRLCISVARNILANERDAEECLNDAFLAAWNTIPPTIPENLGAFLARLTRNIALNRYHYNKAEKRNPQFDILLSELGEVVSSPDDTEAMAEAGFAEQAIDEFLRSIKAESRKMFICRYWYSESIDEIAKNFGVSQSKVKSNLFRTRSKLKDFLEKRGFVI